MFIARAVVAEVYMFAANGATAVGLVERRADVEPSAHCQHSPRMPASYNLVTPFVVSGPLAGCPDARIRGGRGACSQLP